jgi:hypothetical protein
MIDSFLAVLHYAIQLVDKYNRLMEYCQCERNMDAREWQLAQSDGDLSQNQSQLLNQHDDFSRMAEHLIATNVNLDHALGDFEPGTHQHRSSPTDGQHN